MAFKKPTSFLTDPADEEADYLAATSPAGPRYIAPDPNEVPPDPDLDPNAYSPVTPAPVAPVGTSTNPSSYVDPDLDPNAYSPVNPAAAAAQPDPDLDPNAYAPAQPKSAQLRQELEDIAAKRPSKEPGFWRTLAGIGAGIGVGYLTRNANMVANVSGRVMHPGLADWNNAYNDKLAQAEQQEKIEADAQAATKGQADLAHTQAQTRLEGMQADQLGLPDAPPSPEWDVTANGTVYDKHGKTAPVVTPPPPKPLTNSDFIEVLGPDGKTHRMKPDPTDPSKSIDYGVVPAKEAAALQGDVALKVRSQGGTTGVPNIDALTPPQARAALESGKEPKAPNETAQKDADINAAFQNSGRDWNQVKADVQAGKYTNHASDIADHADKMLKLFPQENDTVARANLAEQSIQRAIDAVNTAKEAHPGLVGLNPLHSLARWGETKVGGEPPEVAAADTALEGAMAGMPGLYHFRSPGAEENWKRAAGVDPRGKLDGTHAWLIHPDNTIAGLQEQLQGIRNLKTSILNQHGKPQAQQAAPNTAQAPAPGVSAKVYTQSDVDAAVASHPGLTAAQADQAFKAKGWIKQ